MKLSLNGFQPKETHKQALNATQEPTLFKSFKNGNKTTKRIEFVCKTSKMFASVSSDHYGKKTGFFEISQMLDRTTVHYFIEH